MSDVIDANRGEKKNFLRQDVKENEETDATRGMKNSPGHDVKSDGETYVTRGLRHSGKSDENDENDENLGEVEIDPRPGKKNDDWNGVTACASGEWVSGTQTLMESVHQTNVSRRGPEPDPGPDQS